MTPYQEMMQIIKDNRQVGKKPSLLLHSCCAPCSSQVIMTLKEDFDLTLFFYNPNIHPRQEYEDRLEEQIRLVKDLGLDYEVVHPPYQSQAFFQAVKGLEDLGEFSDRCRACYDLRLRETARQAKAMGMAYFTTTLSISPLKDAKTINALGKALEADYGVLFLPSDFKKKDGYKKSVDYSKTYNLYRQDYCGCIFSKKEAAARKAARKASTKNNQ